MTKIEFNYNFHTEISETQVYKEKRPKDKKKKLELL